jgi:CBS domain-containing protein
MTPQVISCADDADLATAAALMGDRAVRRVVVIDAAERLAGMLSVDDLSLHSASLAGGVVERCRAPDRPAQPRSWKWWD